jgi:hypothetical protein
MKKEFKEFKEFRSSGVQEFRSSGVQEFRSSGVQEFRSSGVQEFSVGRIAKLQARSSCNLRIDYCPAFLVAASWTPATPELLNFSKNELIQFRRKSGDCYRRGKRDRPKNRRWFG